MLIRPKLSSVESRFDPRDFKATFDLTLATPTQIDLRLPTDIVKDQLGVGSCAAHNSTSNLEYLGQTRGIFERLSPRFVYDATTYAEGRGGLSGVVSQRDVWETIRKTGVPLESECPYLNTETPPRPSEAANISAATRKVFRYEAIPLGIVWQYGGPSDVSMAVANCKAALAKGHRIVIALAIGQKMVQFMGTPLPQQYYTPVSKPWLGETDNLHLGGHGVEIVGYNDLLGGWIYKNQWSADWGEGGYGLMQYQATQDWSEAWIVRSYAGLSFEDDLVEYAARKQVVTGYVACLGRAADLGGMLYWTRAVTGGFGLAPLYDDLMNSPEGRAYKPSPGAVLANALLPENRAKFDNQVAVATYCTLDLACDQEPIYKHALDLVTADSASIDAAKFWIRQHMTGGGGIL